MKRFSTFIQSGKQSQQESRKNAIESWGFWRLIMEEKISYTEACLMDDDELQEAGEALTYYNELVKEQIEKGKGKH